MTQRTSEAIKINEQQKKAICFGEGPLLIIAGAGTGKTTVVTQRISHLITEKKVKPSEILALTFTEKASREMEERVDRSLPYGVTQLWISTFHAFCDRILKAEGIHLGINPGYRVMSEAEAIQFFRSHLFSFSLSYFRPLGNPNKFISGILTHINRLKDEDITYTDYQQWIEKEYFLKDTCSPEQVLETEKYKELAAVYEQYEKAKMKEGFFDYADLITQTLLLFRKRPNVLKQYQEQFKYILIDEFQDTNYAQNELAVLLAGKRKNITVVGDDDQSIYRWRGAAIANIIQFRSRFPQTEVVVLTKNYRSTKEILDRSYDLITQNNPDRLEVVEHVEKKLESSRGVHGEKVQVLLADRVENEAEAVVKEIEKRKREAQTQIHTWKDFAILVRANAHADPFIRALARKGIPYQFLGPGQLFRQSEVKDLISYLKLLANYDDSVAAYRVFSLDIFAISARDIATCMAFAKKYGLSFLEVAEIIAEKRQKPQAASIPNVSSDGKEKILHVILLIHKHLALIKKETAGQILYYFLTDTGLLKQFTLYKTLSEERQAANIAKFFDKLKSYEADHEDASVFAVVDWIDLAMSLGESPLASNNDWSETDAVNILTIHSAKGLEFPVVFLVNLVSARFPTTEKKEQIPLPDRIIKEVLPSGDFHMQEERRLFYVGMTRARDVLYLTAAKYYGEGKREKKLSPFISEAVGDIPYTHIENEEGIGQLSLLSWEKQDLQKEKSVKQDISYLSYSQLSSYETCPLQYRYRYMLKIPVPPSAALSFGDTVHKTLQHFYEKVKVGEKPNREMLLTLYKNEWQAVGFGNKAYEKNMYEKGVKLLTSFFEKGYDPHRVPLSLEESFKISITPMLKVGGKIDRVDLLDDGKIEVIDYKTGTAPKARDVANDDQLTLYALAAVQKGMYNKKPEDVIVSFYFLEDQQKVTAARTQEQLESLREKIAAKAEEMRRSDFSPTPGKHCDFCEYKLICEAWS